MEENLEAVVQPEQEVAPVAEQAPTHADNSAEVNMAKLRAAKDKVERERAELAAQVAELKKQQEVEKEPPEPDYGDEDFVEGKHLRKEVDALKKQQQEFQWKQQHARDEARLMERHKDFEKVASPENVEKLKELDPETFATIVNSSTSIYNRGSAAYKRIKELGIFVEDNHVQDRANTQANVAKPRPMNSVSPQQGDSPLSMANAFANGLTDDLKKQLLKEMNESAKRL